MAASPEVSYDRVLRLAFIVGTGFFIFALMHAMFLDAQTRGLNEGFRWVFYAAGFTIYLFVLKLFLKRGE